jgi:hypothetical protein
VLHGKRRRGAASMTNGAADLAAHLFTREHCCAFADGSRYPDLPDDRSPSARRLGS